MKLKARRRSLLSTNEIPSLTVQRQCMRIMQRFLALALAATVAWMDVACMRINVLGHDASDREYIAIYDEAIAREKSGQKPTGMHDEYGRVPSWNELWMSIGGINPDPPTAQSRRLRRYIIEHRRAAGLPELTPWRY